MSLIKIMLENEKQVEEKAYEFVRKNKKSLIDFFVNKEKYYSIQKSVFFMAGSPGAGKTEFVKSLRIKIKNDNVVKPLHVDADLIRTDFLKDFYKPTNIDGSILGNAHLLQKASIKGVEILLDYCFKSKILFILDGTMGGTFDTINKNIKRCLSKNIKPVIFYLYQDPLVAWDYTKQRERVEGRNISKDDFVRQFFNSKKNMRMLKQEYKGEIIINLIIKNFKNSIEKYEFNIDNIDFYIKDDYNSIKDLKDKLI
ncbi:MAG: zeta toxin family protein [Candidatus Pacebacteria bacterium]|nr:zeta toxin family protein [Candidatus Paceibacterota bacterium]